MTSSYLKIITTSGAVELKLSTEVIDIRKSDRGLWRTSLSDGKGTYCVQSPFLFLGAGGGALTLLQKSGISEGDIYGGFPVSGQWLVCNDPRLTEKHNAKVYGKSAIGAPPMSVPHLDSRWIGGKRSLLFGPFAGFTSKFLKQGSRLDLIRSTRLGNLGPMLQVGMKNFDLLH